MEVKRKKVTKVMKALCYIHEERRRWVEDDSTTHMWMATTHDKIIESLQ